MRSCCCATCRWQNPSWWTASWKTCPRFFMPRSCRKERRRFVTMQSHRRPVTWKPSTLCARWRSISNRIPKSKVKWKMEARSNWTRALALLQLWCRSLPSRPSNTRLWFGPCGGPQKAWCQSSLRSACVVTWSWMAKRRWSFEAMMAWVY